MRRSFLLTFVGGVLVTLVGCGGEVATETASTSSTSSAPATSTPASGPGSSTPSSSPSSGPTSPQSGPGSASPQSGPGSATPQSGPGGPPPGMNVLTGPGQTGSGSNSGFPQSYPGSQSGPGGPQSGPGGPQSGPGGPADGGGLNYPPGYSGAPLPGNPTGVAAGGGGGTNQTPTSGPGGPQSGPGGPQSGPGGPANGGGINYPPGYPGGGAPLPGDPSGVAAGGGGDTTGTQTGPPQSGPGSGDNGSGSATMGASVRFGPPDGSVPQSGPGGSPMGPMGPMGGPGQGQAPPLPEPKNLKERAIREFQVGHDADAFSYMHAWYVADPEGEPELDLRLLGVTNLPKTSVRIGIGIEYQAPGNLEGAPPTVGEQPNVLPGNNQNNRQGPGGAPPGLNAGAPQAGGPGSVPPPGPGGFGGGGGAASEPSNSLGQFNYYTGRLGQDLVTRLQMLRTSNEAPFGRFLEDVVVEWPRQAAGSGFGSGFPGGAAGPGGAGFNPTGAAMGGGPGGIGPLGPQGGPGAAPAAGSAVPRDPESNQLIPGVVWLGKGRQAALVEDAREAGLDFLILFDTAIQVVPANGQKKNTTTIILLDVSAEEVRDQVVAKSKPLNSVRVWEEMNRSDEPIEEAIDALFTAAQDKGATLADLPELTAEQAKARVDAVVAGRPEDVLAALAEIKFFHRETLLNDADLLSAYESLLGDADKAQTLATGTAEERLEVVKEFLPTMN